MTRWPTERVARLKRSWDDGLSLSQIARDLGIKSTTAVMRQIDRLGLPERAKPLRRKESA